MPVMPPIDELSDFLDRSSDRFADEMIQLARGMLDGRISTDKWERRLGEQIADVMILADLYGRRRVLLETDAVSSESALLQSYAPITFASPMVPSVPFERAVADLVAREPRLAENYLEVQELYRTKHAFALARSSSVEITKRVQSALATMKTQGTTLARAKDIVTEIGDWARGYAGTVYRTNVSTAYSAGRFREAFHPAVARTMKAFKRFSARDRDVRPNHALAHGLLASTTDPVWNLASPPSGYNCRCVLRLVSEMELERLGQITETGEVIPIYPPGFANFRPDPGFGGRPDLAMYGGAA